MTIDNKPGKEPVARPMAKFEIFTPDRLKTIWGKIIGSEKNLVREEITREGDEPPVYKKEELNNFGIIYEEDSAILHWRDEEGDIEKLLVDKDYYVGVQQDPNTGKRALVFMKGENSKAGNRIKIIKFYIGE